MTDAEIPRLPSQDAAIHVARGVPGGWLEAVGSTLFRAGLIAGGLYAAGQRGRPMWKGAIFGAAAVELFVLGFTVLNVRRVDAAP